MKTSISSRLLPSTLVALSRSNRIVDAGRGGFALSVMRSTRCAGLRLQIGPAIDARDPRQQIIHFRLRGRGDGCPRLALRTGGDHAALLQHVFAYRQSRAGLLLVADQRQMGVEQIVRGVAL